MSSDDENKNKETQEPSTAESFGSWLRKQRESNQASLEDVASVTKIQLSMLKKIEQDDYSGLPAPAFIRGFIVSFARHLGIDETEAVARFRQQLKVIGLDKDLYSQSVEKQEEVAKHAQQLASSTSSTYRSASKGIDINKTPVFTIKRIVIALVAVVVVIVFSVLFRLGTSQEESAVEETSVEASIVEEPKQQQEEEVVATTNDRMNETKPDAKAKIAKPAAKAKEETPPPAPKVVEKKVNADAYQFHLKLRGTDSSWVNVRADQGDSEGSILDKGQTQSFYANKRINIALSDAGSVEIYWNGKWYEPAGYRGDVKSVVLPQDIDKLQIKAKPKPKPVVEPEPIASEETDVSGAESSEEEE